LSVINHIPYIDPYSKRGAVIQKVRGEIAVNNVHFSYPLRPDLKVIHSRYKLYHIPIVLDFKWSQLYCCAWTEDSLGRSLRMR
jgi:hypothetical protein